MTYGHLIVIDGYNLIHRSPDLKPGEGRTLEESRRKLTNLLSWAVGTGDAHFLVVFDGAEGSRREEGGARMTVRYSQPPQKADDVIREIVEDQVDRVERLTVVTADLEVARHARAMGANVVLSDLFLGSVMGPERAAAPTAEKPSQLSKKELEEWAAIFRTQRQADAEDESTH
jgi:predicted RNA-binding protein with PIN domain